jgi:hypothetical protein
MSFKNRASDRSSSPVTAWNESDRTFSLPPPIPTGLGIVEVVEIQPGDDLPATALETFVVGAALASAGVAAVPDLLSVSLKNLPGTVAAAAVENQHLQRGIILAKNTVDGVTQVLGLLIGRDDVTSGFIN